MSDYESTATVEQVARRINDARSLLLTTHVKPDGDGVGSALALSRALRARGNGVEPEIYLMGPLEARLRDIAGDTPYHLAGGRPPQGEYDLIMVLDTGAWTQLEPIADWLRQHREQIVGIDHHAKGDDVAPMRIVDPTAAAPAPRRCSWRRGCWSVAWTSPASIRSSKRRSARSVWRCRPAPWPRWSTPWTVPWPS
ncbi:MAG: DHH family phosphoesterase [Planctomycetota bacterium]|jgi:phosphoesterase RecJ-like protein